MLKIATKICLSILFLTMISFCFDNSLRAGEQSDKARLENVDAVRAMEIANEWKWSKPNVKSYVDSREVVFEFTDGTTKKIPLPKDKMYVAIAPYVDKTHT